MIKVAGGAGQSESAAGAGGAAAPRRFRGESPKSGVDPCR
jgi:hypothetical protein